MQSDRIQRRIERLLDQADAALEQGQWATALEQARAVLGMDPEQPDALAFAAAAEHALATPTAPPSAVDAPIPALSTSPESSPPHAQPTAFASGRYEVKRFLGEGGKKLVYLAHDAKLARDVAFALIKTDGLDEAAGPGDGEWGERGTFPRRRAGGFDHEWRDGSPSLDRRGRGPGGEGLRQSPLSADVRRPRRRATPA